MDFLDKLYSSDYFGIGLFAVISFLVVAFLVVLFFGKKDEQKRKLEETLKLDVQNANQNAFKETGVPIEVSPVVPAPVSPIVVDNAVPINNIVNPQNNIPNAFVNESRINEEPVRPIFEPVKNEIPIIAREEPIVREEVIPDVRVLEPVKVDTIVNPVLKEEVTPIVTPSQPVSNIYTQFEEVRETPRYYDNVRVDVPSVTPTYNEPVVTPSSEVKTPTVDFDAIARSISKELDELENTAKYKEEVSVTPISEVVAPRPVNQFSSVYVNEQPRSVAPAPIDMPQKIDLPTRKPEDIEPESYSI